MTIVIEIDFRWTWGIDNMEFIKGMRLGFIALHFVRARLDFFVNSYQYAMSMVEQQQEALTGWDNNCMIQAKREKEQQSSPQGRGVMDNEKVFIKECASFKWLQVQGGHAYCEMCEVEVGEPYVFIPRLDTLTGLLGDRFIGLHRQFSTGEFWVTYFATADRGYISLTERYETPELACLMALKKIKGE